MEHVRRRGYGVGVRGGFSLVELAVVVIIIGVLAAFGVPRFKDAVERSKAAEAFAYLGAVRSAQERYQALRGIYSSSIELLDVTMPAPKFFESGTLTEDHTTTLGQPQWALTLTRNAQTSAYGSYTVRFTQDGPDELGSTIYTDSDLDLSINPAL